MVGRIGQTYHLTDCVSNAGEDTSLQEIRKEKHKKQN
jgi:hypothetical protein